jgi:hypothetical protein
MLVHPDFDGNLSDFRGHLRGILVDVEKSMPLDSKTKSPPYVATS